MPDDEATEVDQHALAAQIAQEVIAQNERLRRDVFKALFPDSESGLVAHAEREMNRVGVGDPDADYDGWAKDCVLDLMRVFSSQGHSEGSAMLVLDLFQRLAHYGILSVLTSNPDEWMEIAEEVAGVPNLWQSRRRPDAFSTDGGQTWYYLNEPQASAPQSFQGHDVLHRPCPDNPEVIEISLDGGQVWRPERMAAQTNG